MPKNGQIFADFRVAFKAKNGLKRTQFWVGIMLIYYVNSLEAISKLTLAIFGIPGLFSILFTKVLYKKKFTSEQKHKFLKILKYM